ncbi:MAG: MCE family protein [Magnetococcales bacterium]|nr:MCE family protein [Magnetococcales bacterium]MBF0321674.1 MCE family protein [Magnetococcales bacterium]
MPEHTMPPENAPESPPIPMAVAVTRPSFSYFWFIPLIAAAVAVWTAYSIWSGQGPLITISFKTADGLQESRTKVKLKDVEVGTVTQVTLSPDLSQVLVQVRLAKSAAEHTRTGTRFWVVRPRLTASGLTGLNTLVSGSFIEMDPGPGKPHLDYVGLEAPPVVRQGTPGRRFLLRSDRLGSLAVGSPVNHRGIPVGEVQGYDLADDGQGVNIHVFIKAPYHDLVRTDTRFWNSSGVQATVDADGLRLKASSLQALLVGGITLATLSEKGRTPPAPEGTHFHLFDDFDSTGEVAYTRQVNYILYFDGSVRGLKVGAPVEFRGIKVGSVIDVHLTYDPKDATMRIPVLIRLEPERIVGMEVASITPKEIIGPLVQKGLRARLETSNLLTGQRLVAFDYYPDSPIRMVHATNDYTELPTIPGSLEEIAQSTTHLLARLQQMPLEEISQELLQTVAGTNRLVNGPEITTSVESLHDALLAIERLTTDLAKRTGPLVDATRTTMDQANHTLAATGKLLAPDAPLHYSLIDALQEVAAAARALRTLTSLLSQNPQSLLFGRHREEKR